MKPAPRDPGEEPPRKALKPTSPAPPPDPEPPQHPRTLALSEYVTATGPPPVLDPAKPLASPLTPVHTAKIAGFRAAVAARGAALVLLAAGQGSRFVAPLPKVIHPFAGKPLARHGLDAAAAAALPVVAVVGYQRQLVADTLDVQKSEQVMFVCQEQQMGTGHAVYLGTFALPHNFDGDIVVSYADNPGVDSHLLAEILTAHNKNKDRYGDSYAAMVLTGSRKAAGQGAAAYGRIVRQNKDGTGPLVDIVELKTIKKLAEDNSTISYDGVTWSPAELEDIDEFNSGIVVARGKPYLNVLRGILPSQTKFDPPKFEYYATDFVKGLAKRKLVSEGYQIPDDVMWKLEGANTLEELQELERKQISKDAQASTGKTGQNTAE